MGIIYRINFIIWLLLVLKHTMQKYNVLRDPDPLRYKTVIFFVELSRFLVKCIDYMKYKITE